MPVDVEIFNEYTILIKYRGLLTYEDRLAAYTKFLNYSGEHEVRYILIDDVSMMYRENQLIDERLNTLIKDALSQQSVRAIIMTNNHNQKILDKLTENYQSLGISHKLYFAENYDHALDLISKFESEA